jgi:hypothetical protein
MRTNMCITNGCNNVDYRKGMCNKHYTESINSNKLCSVDGCGSSVVSRSLCRFHYQRKRNNKDLNSPKRIDSCKGEICSVNGCGKSVLSKMLCENHYRSALRKNKDPLCGLRNNMHGLSYNRLYKIWCSIISRCYNVKDSAYYNYGGRGIKVCKRWKESVSNFVNDIMKEIGERPSIYYSLDRINNNKNYESGNMKWSTRTEQNRNQRDNVRLTIDGETKLLAEWIEIYGVTRDLVKKRMNRGWDAKTALTYKGRLSDKMLNEQLKK